MQVLLSLQRAFYILLYPFFLLPFTYYMRITNAAFANRVGWRRKQRTQESLNFSYEWANSDCQQVFLPTDIRS